MKRYPSFREFYPFYLGEHANRTRACQRYPSDLLG